MYTRRNWNTGDIVHATEMNNIEDGIERAHTAINALPAPPNLEPYATRSWTAQQIALIPIPSLDGYLQQEDLASYATTAAVQDLIADIPDPDLTGYATEAFVRDAINQAELGGEQSEIDLSIYALDADLERKVDKVAGKGLSTVDFTNELKAKLDGIQAGAQVNPSLAGYATQGDLSRLGQEIYENTLGVEVLNDYADRNETGLIARDAAASAVSGLATANSVNAIADKQLTYYRNGEVWQPKKRVFMEVNTYEAGKWRADYTFAGFTEVPEIESIVAVNASGELADRSIASLGHVAPTTTQATGTLMGATAVGLIGSGLVEKNGKVKLVLVGK